MAVHVLGIRHHGPGSARSLMAALASLQPDAVLVEGPPEGNAVLPLAIDRDMVPPVALLGYAVERPERAVFYPFASFSPEWQAIVHGLRAAVPVRFCDLALAHVLAPRRGQARLGDAAEADDLHDVDPHDDGKVRHRPPDPLGALAHAAGYDDPERWWEDVVEHRDQGPFAAIAEAMAQVRASSPAPIGAAADREAQREAAMRQVIRTTVAQGHERIAVVCGAWHAPALAAPGPAAADARLLRGLPKVKVAVTWVPWTHERLAAASGYGAGVDAPGWYHHLFVHAGPEVLARWFTEAARALRASDRMVSPGHVIEALRLAEALAVVRGRPVAGLEEVRDAARAALGDGTDAPMLLLRERLVVGEALGEVPASTPMVPLARDLQTEQRRLRLKADAGERHLELDLRRERDRQRSCLLHRLGALGLTWGVPEQGRGSSGTFRESWKLRWEPELAVGLIDASAWGTTVEAAATAKVRRQARSATTLGELTRAVEVCLLAELSSALPEVMTELGARAAVDGDVTHLLDALGPLARASRYGDVRGTTAAALDQVVDGMVVRIAAGLVPAAAALDEEVALAFAERLKSASASLSLLDRPVHRVQWSSALAGLLAGERLHGVVRGTACRLLLDGGELPAGAAGGHLSRALSIGTPPAVGAAFVEGFLAGSGTVLVHDTELLGLLDGWLAALGTEAFTAVVPLLRRTFGTFEPSERRLIGELVAGGLDDRRRVVDAELDDGRVMAAVAVVRELLGARP